MAQERPHPLANNASTLQYAVPSQTQRFVRRSMDAQYTDLNDVLDTVPEDPTLQTSLMTGMPWVSADRTDVQRTWRKYGWVPPSEAKRAAKGG